LLTIDKEDRMAVPGDRRTSRRTSRYHDELDDDDDRERVRGIGGGYDPYQGRGRERGQERTESSGYVRSDERIREEVCDRLTDDPSLDASSIEVKVKNGEVTLSGTVDSRRARRHAEDLSEEVSGIKHLQNNLRVQEAGPDIDIGPTS